MTEVRPIIVIGAARSGTKFLRDIMAVSDDVQSVPYDVNYVWRYGATSAADDQLDPANLTEERKQFIRKTLRRLAGPKGRNARLLVEKSVSNSLRVPFVNEVFPDARFVHLVRDGREVAESAMRQWQAPPDWRALAAKLRTMPLANLGYLFWFASNFVEGVLSGHKGGKVWGPRFRGIERVARDQGLAAVCAQQWVESVSAAKRDLAALPDGEARCFEVRYEELVADESVLRRLCEWIGVHDTDRVLAAYRSRLRNPTANQWLKLPEQDQQTFANVMGPALRMNGY